MMALFLSCAEVKRMKDVVVQTPRLWLRPMGEQNWQGLCEILQDSEAMYAYEHAFSDEEVRQWLQRQQKRYQDDGFGLWAAIRRSDGKMVGQIGLTMQEWDGKQVPEVGYLLSRQEWHKGYATEGARACRDYAFETLGFSAVYSIIRDNNAPSIAVARRNGMYQVGRMVKHYYGMEMPHLVFCVKKEEIR